MEEGGESTDNNIEGQVNSWGCLDSKPITSELTGMMVSKVSRHIIQAMEGLVNCQRIQPRYRLLF
jgi:hypothetical protein